MKRNLLKKYRYWILAAALALIAAGVLLFVLTPKKSAPAGANLIAESDFSGLRAGESAWYTDAYVMRQEYTEFSFDEGRDGGVSGHIVNKIGNDARFAMDVDVEPDSLYCLSGWIRADCREGLGANLSVAGVYAFSEPVYDTAGEWKHVEFYGRTGARQTGITVFARLGGYSGEAVGEAWFDQVELRRVESLPEGARAAVWWQETQEKGEDAGDAGNRGPALPSIGLVFCSLLYLGLIVFLAALRPRGLRVRLLPAALILFGAGLLVRVILAGAVHGYDVDVGDFCAWGQIMAENGPGAFYTQAGFCDYPPGYIWILGFFAKLAQWLGLPVSETVIKLPPILADLLSAALVTVYIAVKNRKEMQEGRCPLTFLMPGALCLMNPMILLTGAGWGQSDSVMMLFLLITVLTAMEGWWYGALPAYVTAVLVKPQALMFGPLGLAALAVDLIARRRPFDKMVGALVRFGAGVLISAGAAALIILPFQGGQPFGWLIELYGRTMGYYAYATVNACNLYFLIGANWVETAQTASFWFPLLAGQLLAAPAVPALVRAGRNNRGERALCVVLIALGGLVTLTALFPFSYQVYSTALIALSVVFCMYALVRAGRMSALPLYGAVLLALLFNFGGMMHERYLFAALPLLALAWYLEKDDRVLLVLGLLTVASFLNAGCVLSRNARIGGASGHLTAPLFGIQSDMTALEYLSAALSVLGAGLMLYLGVRRSGKAWQPVTLRMPSVPEAPAEEQAAPADEPPVFPEKEWLRNHRMDKKDWAVLTAVTLCYALLAFWHLGAVTSPQTGYMLSEVGETVTFDLGENREDFRMLYIGGVHQYDRDFTVTVSEDGETWGTPYSCNMDIGNLFQWYYVRSWEGDDGLSLSGRYVRITGRPGLNLYEVVFRDREGNVLPVAGAVSSAGADVAALWDEQRTLSGEPGWYNSMYFDEIYHARTAYEHLMGMYPYETTHPPLGKVIMSWCVGLFGMTPFGWRFAGTMCGVLMLPAMYLLGRLLFRKRRFAVLAVLLMALDTMHYTQTRLATIDSFVVLFILWSVYFMLRWFYTDFFGRPLIISLAPLGLSGLFMGLAVASKWTGCYAGVGLAVLFAIGLWRRARHIRAVRRYEAGRRETEDPPQGAKPPMRGHVLRLWMTVLSCFVFFVAVPLGIYYLSYIPYFAPSGGITVRKVIEAGAGMLSYHSQPGLGMDHPFYSPWYEWPFSVKPMYYAADAYEPEGFACTILAFGNPAVWWTGFAAMLLVFWALLRHQAVPLLTGGRPDRKPGFFCPAGEKDIRPLLLTVCFAAQYLPWMLVPRGTYIYHYFPSVPFIILAVCLIAEYWTDRAVSAADKPARAARADRGALWWVIGYIALTALVFIALFPYASGMLTPTGWLDAVNWFNNLYY